MSHVTSFCVPMLPNQQKKLSAVFLHEVIHEIICHCHYKADFRVQWKRTQISDIYRLNKRIQSINRQNVHKVQCCSLVLWLSNFSGEFDLLVTD